MGHAFAEHPSQNTELTRYTKNKIIVQTSTMIEQISDTSNTMLLRNKMPTIPRMHAKTADTTEIEKINFVNTRCTKPNRRWDWSNSSRESRRTWCNSRSSRKHLFLASFALAHLPNNAKLTNKTMKMINKMMAWLKWKEIWVFDWKKTKIKQQK